MGLIKSFIVFLITKVLYKIFSQNLKVETININIENKQQSTTTTKKRNESYKIIQLSDIHYDHIPLRISDSFLDRIIKTTNDLNPDLIVITGDLVERAPEPIVELYKKHLSKLKAKYGVYAILGNHDYKTVGGSEIIKNALKNTNINLLENEICYPMGNNNGIQLIGIDSYSKRNHNGDSLYQEIKSSSLIKFVLLHNPDHIKELQNKLNQIESNVDIVVAGHSHGSQLCIPGFGFGPNKPLMPYFEKMLTFFPKFIRDIRYPGKKTIKNWKYGKGLHQFINKTNNSIINFYINRGLGTHPPFRIFCDPEITVFNINSSPPPSSSSPNNSNNSKPDSITFI